MVWNFINCVNAFTTLKHSLSIAFNKRVPFSYYYVKKIVDQKEYSVSSYYKTTWLTEKEKSIAVRLIGPSSFNGTGRVEVFYNGQWGTICDDYWDINDAMVVCRQIFGLPYAVRALYGYHVPDGTGQIWLDNVRCTGNEKSLINCSHSGWGNHNCRHYQDAGVECSS
ncbi:deleted in malignant brain tumors 1 -like, partial [Paramuricea clavata]